MDTRKFYSIELKKASEIDAIKKKMKEMSVYYEVSGCYGLVHFEVNLSSDEVITLNSFLNTI